MIIPCIDLMDGKVVQLVQGREKALEGASPAEMLRRFAAFPQIQVIDLDAALNRGSNQVLVRMLAGLAVARVGGGVRTVERAEALFEQFLAEFDGKHSYRAQGIEQQYIAEAKGQLACKSVDLDSGKIQSGRGNAVSECFRVDAKGKILDTQYRLLAREGADASRSPDDSTSRDNRDRELSASRNRSERAYSAEYGWSRDSWREAPRPGCRQLPRV